MSGALEKPSPSGGWSEEIVTLDDAVVVPPLSSDFIQPAGILDRDGRFCDHGALWRKHRPITVKPPAPEGEIPRLAGRWLWGGILWSHFGHFLAESTARLWALDHLDRPVAGVLFIPKRPRMGEGFKGFHQPFFDALGMTEPVKVATDPVRVEELVVPGQGFGIGEISAGTEKVRTGRLARIGAHIAADGPERLYISRSALGYVRGSIPGEAQVEARLAAEGYEIFHPQQHPIAVQIARYKAARQIVATDGSALHLVAMTGPQNRRIAVIQRRKSSAVDFLLRHVESFTGDPPLALLSLRRTWFPEGRSKTKRLALGELDLPAIGAALKAGGFVGSDADWRALPESEIQTIFAGTGQAWQMPAWLVRQLAREGPLAAK